MKIADFGGGEVGGYFGGRLAFSGAEVHLIRGPHLEALRTEGLRVRSVKGDSTAQLSATDDPSKVGACDCVLFTVKAFDTDQAAASLHPLIDGECAVLSFQSGMDN